MSNYRKIYKQHYGSIPKDNDGRSYDIHHIDGDHKNNSIENLKAVSIQEHYDIHYAQGDWYACLRIAEKMKLSPLKISELATKQNLKRVANGKHPWQTRPDGTNLQTDKVVNGTHHLLGPKLNLKRVKNGTHHLLKRSDGTSVTSDRVKNGTNPFLTRPDGTSVASDRVANGTHNFLDGEIQRKSNQERLAKGTHHLLTNNPNKIRVTCPYCLKIGGAVSMKRYHFDNCKFKPSV